MDALLLPQARRALDLGDSFFGRFFSFFRALFFRAVPGIIFGLALCSSLTLNLVALFLRLAAHQVFFLTLALLRFAHT